MKSYVAKGTNVNDVLMAMGTLRHPKRPKALYDILSYKRHHMTN